MGPKSESLSLSHFLILYRRRICNRSHQIIIAQANDLTRRLMVPGPLSMELELCPRCTVTAMCFYSSLSPHFRLLGLFTLFSPALFFHSSSFMLLFLSTLTTPTNSCALDPYLSLKPANIQNITHTRGRRRQPPGPSPALRDKKYSHLHIPLPTRTRTHNLIDCHQDSTAKNPILLWDDICLAFADTLHVRNQAICYPF